MDREQTKTLIDKALSFSKADETFVLSTAVIACERSLRQEHGNDLGASSGYNLAITASVRQAVGDRHDRRVRRREFAAGGRNAEEIAKLSPENPEAVPALGPQTFAPVKAFFDDAANASPDWRARRSERHRVEQEKDVVSAGFVETQSRSRQSEFEGTVRLRSLHGSGLQPDGSDAGQFRVGVGVEVVQRAAANSSRRSSPRSAIDKAAQAKNPSAIEPGKYTVILEPAAIADLLAYMIFSADARQADEGRSFFSKKGGGNRVGEQVIGEKVTSTRIPRTRSRRRSRSTTRGCRSAATSGSKKAS